MDAGPAGERIEARSALVRPGLAGPAHDLMAGTRRALREAFWQVVLGAIVPFFLFYQVRDRVSLTAAIVSASLWSGAVILWAWRARSRFDIITAGALAALVLNATVGILSQDATLYFALPAAEHAVYVVVLVLSVVLRRPLFGVIAAQFTGAPPSVTQRDAWRRAFSVVTLAWAAGAVLRIIARLGLLFTVGVDLFLVLYPAFSYTLSAGLLVFPFWYPNHVFRREPLPVGEAAEEAAAQATVPTNIG